MPVVQLRSLQMQPDTVETAEIQLVPADVILVKM